MINERTRKTISTVCAVVVGVCLTLQFFLMHKQNDRLHERVEYLMDRNMELSKEIDSLKANAN